MFADGRLAAEREEKSRRLGRAWKVTGAQVSDCPCLCPCFQAAAFRLSVSPARIRVAASMRLWLARTLQLATLFFMLLALLLLPLRSG